MKRRGVARLLPIALAQQGAICPSIGTERWTGKTQAHD